MNLRRLMLPVALSLIMLPVFSQSLFESIQAGETTKLEEYIQSGGDLTITEIKTPYPADTAALSFMLKSDGKNQRIYYSQDTASLYVKVMGIPESYEVNLLQWAIIHNNRYAVDILMDEASPIPQFLEKGLAAAVSANNLELAAQLIDGGADISYPCEICEGYSTLIMAFYYNNTEMFNLLMNYGADINAGDKDGNRLIHHAIWEGNEKMVKWIIKSGGDLNIKNNDRNTPLHVTFEAGNTKIAKTLLEAGAATDIPDGNGHTLLDLVLEYGFKEWKKLLKMK